MSIYTKPILELIAKRPGIRTVEIADLVDCEPEMVQPAIQAEIDAKRIIVKPVTAPNGKPANAFIPCPSLVEQYRPVATASPAVEKPARSVQPGNPAVQPKTKVQAAEMYLAKHGKATVDEMREVLQCDKKAHPNSYLAVAIGKGRIIWEDGIYRPGSFEERRAARTARMSGTVRPEVVEASAKFLEASLPNPITTTETRPVEQPEAPATAPALTPIKVQLIEEPTFTIQFGTVSLPGMRLASEWNGMKELRDAHGRSLIVLAESQGPFSMFFSNLWDKQPQDIVVIKGHPELIDRLESAVHERKAA